MLRQASGERLEYWRLFGVAFWSVSDALEQCITNDELRRWSSEFIRSPWTCLGTGGFCVVVFVLGTWGVPATRQLLVGSLAHPTNGHLVLMWLQPFGRRPGLLPADVVPDFRKFSRSLQSVASFTVKESVVDTRRALSHERRIVLTDEHLFEVLRTRPAIGSLKGPEFTAIDYRTWITLFHGDPNVIGEDILINGKRHKVSAVLPKSFQFLSRKPSIFLGQAPLHGANVMVIGRAHSRADLSRLNRELITIAREADLYHFGTDPRLHSVTVQSILFTPIRLFALSVAASLVCALTVSRFRLRHARAAMSGTNRRAAFRRAAFFTAKLVLGLTLIFLIGLEFTRTESSMLLSGADGASGLTIVWCFVAGSLASFLWAVADQRARCRECLRLLTLPVRIGSPGRMLLDWSGTEMLCLKGHGVLHVPEMETSANEGIGRWITLDESWRSLFKTGQD